jgi:hypothetical protein
MDTYKYELIFSSETKHARQNTWHIDAYIVIFYPIYRFQMLLLHLLLQQMPEFSSSKDLA